MSRLGLCLLLMVALAGGCGRHVPDAAARETDPSLAAPPSPRGPGPMPIAESNNVVIDAANMDVALQQLTQELRNYVVRTRSVPRNFDEFIAGSHVQAPPPPAGKKYAIRGQAVVLVKL